MSGIAVAKFHDNFMTQIKEAAAARDLPRLCVLGNQLRTIVDSGTNQPRNVAAGLLTYCRTCYRNISDGATVKTATVTSSAHATRVTSSLPAKRGYTVVHAHYRKIG